jgi:hypothetical protein
LKAEMKINSSGVGNVEELAVHLVLVDHDPSWNTGGDRVPTD